MRNPFKQCFIFRKDRARPQQVNTLTKRTKKCQRNVADTGDGAAWQRRRKSRLRAETVQAANCDDRSETLNDNQEKESCPPVDRFSVPITRMSK